MTPRLRILFFALVLAFVSAPTQALAATACGPDPGPFAGLGVTDTTDAPAGWQLGSPAGTVSVDLDGVGADNWEWKLDCAVTASTTDPAVITGDGTYTFSHRARAGTADWTPWVDETVQIDSTAPVNTSAPPTGWSRSPVTVAVTGTDISPLVKKWWIEPSVTKIVTDTATIPATPGASATYQLHTEVTDAVGNVTERTHAVMIDNVLPVDLTTTPVGWQSTVVSIDVHGTDDSLVGGIEYKLDDATIHTVSGTTGFHVPITTHGTHSFSSRIVDAAGNRSAWIDKVVQLDLTLPIDLTDVPVGWVTTSTDVAVFVKGTDADGSSTEGSGIAKTEWKITDLATGVIRSDSVLSGETIGLTVSGNGKHVLETRFTDGLGKQSLWKVQEINIDTITPEDTTNLVTGWVKAASLVVKVEGTDANSGVASVEWQLNGVLGGAAGSSSPVTIPNQGPNTLETRVIDGAGHASTWKTQTIRLDTTAPLNLTPSGHSLAWRSAPYSVLLDGDDAGSGLTKMGWRLDTGLDLEGTPGVKVDLGTTGDHTLYTWAIDALGNKSVERAETVRIDLVAPTDATTYPSPSVAVPRGRKITFTGADANSGVAALEWTLDSGAPQTTGSLTFATGGVHTIVTRVRDNAGNWGASTSRTVTVNAALPPEDTDLPIDTTVVSPDWQPGAYTVTVDADDGPVGSGINYVEWRINGALTKGASGSTVNFTTDGVYKVETRATDKANLKSGWKLQYVKIDSVQPTDTTALPAGWAKTRTFTLSAIDLTSKVAAIEYTINGGPTVSLAVTADAPVTAPVPGDGAFTISHRAIDTAGQASEWRDDTYRADTVSPANSSPAAPTVWQTATLSLPLAGTDAGGVAASGFDHGEWRVAGGATQSGATATVATDGIQTFETQAVDAAGNASGWRLETIRIDGTLPVNTTPLPAAPWRNSTYTATVSGTDVTSGMARTEYKVDTGSTFTSPAVSIAAVGAHTLLSRVIDVAGNASAWRTDSIGIDKTVPALAVDCGGTAWRSAPAACTVVASGGESGLPTLTVARGSGTAEAVVGGSYTTDADGSATLNFRAVDGAGNETLAHVDVRIDQAPPAATVSCAADAGTGYVCTGSGSDNLSGLAALTWSVDGSAPAPFAGGSFAVKKGTVVVTAIDGAGNATASDPIALADRTPPPAPVATPTPPKVAVTPRTASEAVLLRGGGSPSARLLGQLSISATPSRTTVDLRPLALGKGRFQFLLTIKSGKKTTTVRKTQTTKLGYSQRITVRVATAAHAEVVVTVRRYSGGRWVTHAAGSAELG